MRPSYSALVEPQGIYLIEYSRDKGGMHVVSQRQIAGALGNVDEAALRLRSAINGDGGDSSDTSVVIRGFGSAHHIMALPPAKPDVLRPIITRELNKIFVGLNDPVVEFTQGGEYDRRQTPRQDVGTPQQELLVAAAPRSLIQAFTGEDGELDTVTHLTVLPQVMRRLFEQLDNSEEPTALVLALPGGPEFAFFHERELRLIIEVPKSAAKPWAAKLGMNAEQEDDAKVNVQTLVDRITRGSTYLRQQFRGAVVSRILLACDESDRERVKQGLEQDLGIEVIPFAPEVGSPAAIAALGAAIDSESASGLNLLASKTGKVHSTTDNSSKKLLALSAAVLGVIMLLWALGPVVSAARWQKNIDAQNRALSRQAPAFQTIKAIADQRAANVQSRTLFNTINERKDKLRNILRSIALTTPGGVQLDQISLTPASPTGDGWNGSVSGISSGLNTAQAVEGVDIFYRDLQAQLSGHTLTLDDLDYLPGVEGNTDINIKFKITFSFSGSAP